MNMTDRHAKPKDAATRRHDTDENQAKEEKEKGEVDHAL